MPTYQAAPAQVIISTLATQAVFILPYGQHDTADHFFKVVLRILPPPRMTGRSCSDLLSIVTASHCCLSLFAVYTFSQDEHLNTFKLCYAPDQVALLCRAVICIMGCLVEFLASTPYMPAAPPHTHTYTQLTTKTIPGKEEGTQSSG